MNFTIKTIGCKVNTYESNRIKDELIKLGLVYIDVENKDEYKNLDFYIVNTCSVTSIADKKSRQMLHLAKKHNPNVKVIAIGCMVDSLSVGADFVSPKSVEGSNENPQSVGASFTSPQLEGVDYLLSNKDKHRLPELLSTIIHSKRRGELCEPPVGASFTSPTTRIRSTVWASSTSPNTRIRSFIKIQDGCNQYCTYCIIPYLRGNISSRTNEDIINEVREKAKNGAKEIVLTGIHLSSFGLDRFGLQYENEGAIEVARKSLLEIMKQIVEIDDVERIRLGSLEPRIIDNSFLESLVGIDAIHSNRMGELCGTDVGASSARPLPKKFCANFCLSLQSGCDKILRRMNRHYTTTDYENACNLIRKYIPYATITTDVIVGFPGETEDDFNESLSFVKKIRFYNPNIFPYSRRKGTKADAMDGQLTNQVKHDRARLMISECEKISREIENDYNKVDHEILAEEIIVENGVKYAIGYTKEYIKKKIVIKT